MNKNLKDILAQRLAENTLRHAEAQQEADLDLGREFCKIALDRIDPNPYQPRRVFNEEDIQVLAHSIAETGLLQPVVVRKVDDRYQLVAGERRFRAVRLLGWRSIEALISPADESDMAVQALTENLEREDLSDFEIGKALRHIEKAFPTRKKLAEALGMNREDMYRYFAFDDLPEMVIQRLNLNPRLLSRSAAADLRRALNSTDDVILRQAACEEAWPLLEAGALEQTKLAAYVRRLLTETSSTTAAASAVSTVNARSGDTIATWHRGRHALTVKIPVAVLTPEREAQLQAYLQSLFETTESTSPLAD